MNTTKEKATERRRGKEISGTEKNSVNGFTIMYNDVFKCVTVTQF